MKTTQNTTITEILDYIESNCFKVENLSYKRQIYRLIGTIEGGEEEEQSNLLENIREFIRKEFNYETFFDPNQDFEEYQLFDSIEDKELLSLETYLKNNYIIIRQG